jgi:hypothetical protein
MLKHSDHQQILLVVNEPDSASATIGRVSIYEVCLSELGHAGDPLLTFLQTHEATEGVFQLGDSEFAKV